MSIKPLHDRVVVKPIEADEISSGGIGEPGRLAVEAAADVFLVGEDGRQRRRIGVDDVAIQGQQVLVLEAGFEQRLQPAAPHGADLN